MSGWALTAMVLSMLSLGFVTAAAVVARRELRALVPVAPRLNVAVDELLVVIPARNEADRIGPVLESILVQPGVFEILVVDDRSTDGTDAVVSAYAERDARVRVLRLHEDPPPGTFGKPHALQAALDDARARSSLPARVLFLDADVELAPGALAGLLAAFESCGAGALSGVPALVCRTPVEQLFVPALVSIVTGRFPPTQVHRHDTPVAFLNGQLIIARSAELMALGGWNAVRETVLEDVALARHLKRNNVPLRMADLRGVARTRMYASWSEIVEGFGKNATALLGPGAGLVGILACAVSLLPSLALAAAGLSGDDAALTTVGFVVLAVLTVQAAIRHVAGAARWPVLVLPVVYLGAAMVLCRASLRDMRGAPRLWRGRAYPTRTKGR